MSRPVFPFMTGAEVATISVSATDATKTPQRLRDVLSDHGVALVTGVLDSKECAKTEQLWQQDLISLVDRSKVVDGNHRSALRKLEGKQGLAEWPDTLNKQIGHAGRGFACKRGMPHGHFAWSCRLNERVRTMFAAVHDTPAEDLCVGLDNVMWAPPDAEQAKDNLEWLHCDQNHNTGLKYYCVQGILYTWPSNKPRASTTVVWPGSHRPEVYDTVMADGHAIEHGRNSWGQLVKLNMLRDAAGIDLHKRAVAGAKRVPCPPGSLLLWDSRTIHQGWSGGPRLAQPVCWEPTERRDPQALRRKQWMCATGCPSSHSSTEGRIHAMGPGKMQTPLPPSAKGTTTHLPLKDLITPFAVKPDQEAAWRKSHAGLWSQGNARKNADRKDLGNIVEPLLRDEVNSVL